VVVDFFVLKSMSNERFQIMLTILKE